MLDANRKSPRTAIREWLQDADSKLTATAADTLPKQRDVEQSSRHRSRRHRWTRYPSETEGPHDEEAGRKRPRYSKSRSRQKSVMGKTLLPSGIQAQSQRHSKANAAVTPDGHGLAERLGLHAPFRTFKDRSDDNLPDVQNPLRKRRRSKSSTSSYLEFAATNDLSDNHHARSSHPTILRTVSKGPALDDGGTNSPSTASKDSETLSPPPEERLKSYEKRPRHKTRADRYELKDSCRRSKKTKHVAKKDREEKERKKPKRKEKSGAALMHGFAAQNVAHHRLTLKPAKTLGLFGKGKASSPVRRRGLPDLAFSEMTFLTSRREKPKDLFEDSSNKPSDAKKQRKLNKAADTEAEFSRYFLSAKPTSIDLTTSHHQGHQQNKRHSQNDKPPRALVDPSERSFLGFGGCGPNTSVSPAQSSVNKDLRSLGRGVARSPTASTSYLTWSRTRGPSYASSPPNRRHHLEPLQPTNLSNRNHTSPAPHKAQHLVPPVSPPHVQTTSSGAQSAASGPPSKQKTTNKAPDPISKPPLATAERSRSREKSQNRDDAGNVEPRAVKIPQNIDGSISDVIDPTKAATHDCLDSALPTLNQTARNSSGHEPRCKPPAHDLRPMSTQLEIYSPHRDQLDDILEALLRDCNTDAARSDRTSRATLSHLISHGSEESRVAAEQQDSREPASAFVNSMYASGPSASAPDSSKRLCNSQPQLVEAIDNSMPMRTPSKGNLNASSRQGLGYPGCYSPSPLHNKTDSGNAWNGYNTFYGRQQEKVDVTSGISLRQILPNEAVQDELIGTLGECDHSHELHEQAIGRLPAEVRDCLGDYRPYSFESLQEGPETNNHRSIGRDEWHDQHVDGQMFNDSGPLNLDASYEGSDDGIMALNDANVYEEKEQLSVQSANKQGIEDQHINPDMSEGSHSWRPRHVSRSTYSFHRCPANAWVEGVDSALSEFWTPHKLY